MKPITINVSNYKYENLIKMTEEEREKYINRAIDIINAMRDISLVKSSTNNMYKTIVESIYEITRIPNPTNRYQLKSITQKVADKLFNGTIDAGLSVRISKQMKDMNLKTESGSGNYRGLNTLKHDAILNELYTLYLK